MAEEMKGMATPTEPTALEAAPQEMEQQEPSIAMETLMGNFMDMPQERRQLATRLLASPAASLVDEIIGEPVMARLVEQLGTPIEASDTAEADQPAPEGMMAPTPEEPMADMPMEEEEATPPV